MVERRVEKMAACWVEKKALYSDKQKARLKAVATVASKAD